MKQTGTGYADTSNPVLSHQESGWPRFAVVKEEDVKDLVFWNETTVLLRKQKVLVCALALLMTTIDSASTTECTWWQVYDELLYSTSIKK